MELAFVAGLQRMPPRQAAAMVLCDVLGFAAEEVATCSAPARPRQGHPAAGPRRGGPVPWRSRAAGGPAAGAAQERALARRFAEAYVAADIDSVIALLTDDAWLSMPPAPHQYHGTAAIRSFLRASFGFRGDRRMYLVPTRANTQPALAGYLSGPGPRTRPPTRPDCSCSPWPDEIQAVTRFHLDELYPRFGLAESLPEPAVRPEPRLTGLAAARISNQDH